MSAYLVVVPPVPALLPEYAGLVDPVAQLRTACRGAVSWLIGHGASQVVVVGDLTEPDNAARGVTESLATRVARALLTEADFTGEILATTASLVPPERHVLVLANGSARRGEKAPGHLDQRSFAFDDAIENALRSGDPAALLSLDLELASALMASGAPALRSLSSLADSRIVPTMLYADDPFGVRYWVTTWEYRCGHPTRTAPRSSRTAARGRFE
jgi:hypothetical protein